MLQSNPPEGNQQQSDSNGHGVWAVQQGKIVGRFVEFKASHQTGKHIGKGVIEFIITARTDTFTGQAKAYSYDQTGKITGEPKSTPVKGTRLKITELKEPL